MRSRGDYRSDGSKQAYVDPAFRYSRPFQANPIHQNRAPRHQPGEPVYLGWKLVLQGLAPFPLSPCLERLEINREADNDLGASPLFAGNAQITTVRLHHLIADGQAQPRSNPYALGGETGLDDPFQVTR